MPYPDIQQHGAATGVTGSCHQLHMDEQHSLLVDCGLFQDAETSQEGKAGAGQLAIDFDISTLKALLLPHVHIDHVGRLPYPLAAGFKGQSTAVYRRRSCCPWCWRTPSSSP